MKEIEDELKELKDNTSYWEHFHSVFVKALDDENIILLAEMKELLKDTSSIAKEDVKRGFVEEYLPYYYRVVNGKNNKKIHNYIFTYPCLTNSLKKYNCSSLNKISCYELETIKSESSVDTLLNLNRIISFNIAQLLMKKDTFTTEELYQMFIKTFPGLYNFSLKEFKIVYKNLLPANGIIKRDLRTIIYSIANIPYINEHYERLLSDCLSLRSEELLNYLRKVVVKYLHDINFKEKIAGFINKIDFDSYLDTLLLRDTLAKKLKK